MNFRQLVINDMDTKYKDMWEISTKAPLMDMQSFVDNTVYKNKREKYLNRLAKEKSNFNDSLKKINNTQKARLKEEDNLKKQVEREGKSVNKSKWWTNIGFFLMLFIVFIALANGAHVWASEKLIPAVGFKSFFDFNNIGKVPCIISAVIAGIVAFTTCIIIMKKGDYDFEAVIGFLFFGFPIVGGIVGGITFLAIRLLIVGIGYLLFLCFHAEAIVAICIISSLTMLVSCRSIKLKRYRVKIWVNILLYIIETILIFYIAKQIIDGNSLLIIWENFLEKIRLMIS